LVLQSGLFLCLVLLSPEKENLGSSDGSQQQHLQLLPSLLTLEKPGMLTGSAYRRVSQNSMLIRKAPVRIVDFALTPSAANT
jgi:hypothetical protein